LSRAHKRPRNSLRFYSIKLRCEIETANKSRSCISIDRLYPSIDITFASQGPRLPSGGVWLGNMTMQSVDYRHLREALMEMALQRPDSPEGARWLAVAQACLKLERQSPDVVRAHRGRPLRQRTARPLRPQGPAAQQDKTAGRTELPHHISV
jgi:hypothetical protein